MTLHYLFIAFAAHKLRELVTLTKVDFGQWSYVVCNMLNSTKFEDLHSS